MKRFTGYIFTLIFLATVIGPGMAQSLKVAINGSPVRFQGTQPMAVRGRVMVPLRGVLEQMGAFVGWEAATQTVFAQKSGTDVQLRIGSKTALVNGNTVTLDVPAQIIGGSTLVPLRFLSEALGSDVAWDNITRTVMITTTASSTDPPVSTVVNISSFTQNSNGWLKAGSVLEVVMEATSGGGATFEIPGVVDGVVMKEISPGQYVGKWTVPAAKNLTVTDGKVLGQLRIGSTQRLIQAGNPVSIDTIVPKIINGTPEAKSTVVALRPSISVVTEDSGSGIDPARVSMSVNGIDVTDQAIITKNFATYRPQDSLRTGQNNVKVVTYDRAGNTATLAWSFDVQGAENIIKSFTHSDISNLQPGDVITANLVGQPGGKVSFSIVSPKGLQLVTQPMQETSSGTYEGQYTVRKGQDLNMASIVGSFKTSSGQTYKTTSETTINTTTAVAEGAPVITAPVEGKSIISPLVITGIAPPNSSVNLKVEYTTKILGLFETNGQLSDQTIDVDSKGKFKSTPISLTTLVSGKGTQYTITAITIFANENESEPTIVTVKGN